MQLSMARNHDKRRIGVWKWCNKLVMISIPNRRLDKSELGQRSNALPIVKVKVSHTLGMFHNLSITMRHGSNTGKIQHGENNVGLAFRDIVIGEDGIIKHFQ